MYNKKLFSRVITASYDLVELGGRGKECDLIANIKVYDHKKAIERIFFHVDQILIWSQ